MKKLSLRCAESLAAAGLLLTVAVALGVSTTRAADEAEFKAVGTFVDGCSCTVPCTCEMGSLMHGCKGVGAIVLTSGTYKGVDLSGAKVAYATVPGNWVRFYVDAKNPEQEKAATEFGSAAMKDFGKVDGVKKAKVELKGSGGKYSLEVDGGKTIQLTTEPVMGIDKKTPMSYHNTFNIVSPTVLQGKTVKGSYHDGDRSFTLGGTNAYFNGAVKSSGKV